MSIEEIDRMQREVMQVAKEKALARREEEEQLRRESVLRAQARLRELDAKSNEKLNASTSVEGIGSVGSASAGTSTAKTAAAGSQNTSTTLHSAPNPHKDTKTAEPSFAKPSMIPPASFDKPPSSEVIQPQHQRPPSRHQAWDSGQMPKREERALPGPSTVPQEITSHTESYRHERHGAFVPRIILPSPLHSKLRKRGNARPEKNLETSLQQPGIVKKPASTSSNAPRGGPALVDKSVPPAKRPIQQKTPEPPSTTPGTQAPESAVENQGMQVDAAQADRRRFEPPKAQRSAVHPTAPKLQAIRYSKIEILSKPKPAITAPVAGDRAPIARKDVAGTLTVEKLMAGPATEQVNASKDTTPSPHSDKKMDKLLEKKRRPSRHTRDRKPGGGAPQPFSVANDEVALKVKISLPKVFTKYADDETKSYPEKVYNLTLRHDGACSVLLGRRFLYLFHIWHRG